MEHLILPNSINPITTHHHLKSSLSPSIYPLWHQASGEGQFVKDSLVREEDLFSNLKSNQIKFKMDSLELYGSERDRLADWIQLSVLDKNTFCIPAKFLFKLLRMSNISNAYAEMMTILQPTEYILKSKTTERPDKTTMLSIEGACTYCFWLYSRRKYSERVYKRAISCFGYIREISAQMLDTLEIVRQVVIQDGIDRKPGMAKLDTREITSTVIAQKRANGTTSVHDVLKILRSCTKASVNGDGGD